jgi:hypothetical protein
MIKSIYRKISLEFRMPFYRLRRAILRPLERIPRTRQDIAKWRLSRLIKVGILSGPFKGMKYVHRSIESGYTPKLFGTYERELHPILEELFKEKFDLIVDVGAAEGYYAVGLAMRFPVPPVIAYEAIERGQELIAEMACFNGVETRIEIKGYCSREELKATLERSINNFILMDVEGAELELLRPDLIPALKYAHILLELHDCFYPGLSREIESRFISTHTITGIKQTGRTTDDLPVRSLFFDEDYLRMISEDGRSSKAGETVWFYLKPLAKVL